MRIIEQSFEMETPLKGKTVMATIERAGRTCYKSEDKTTSDSAEKFVEKILTSGHHSVIEHAYASVRMITNRGVTHEIVRHRIASYSQESTRYCNYSKSRFGEEITVILPVWFREAHEYETGGRQPGKGLGVDPARYPQYLKWLAINHDIERAYFALVADGQSPQEARDILPNALKTEIVMTANLREWMHFFKLRAAPAAHPQMRDLAESILAVFREELPTLFGPTKPA